MATNGVSRRHTDSYSCYPNMSINKKKTTSKEELINQHKDLDKLKHHYSNKIAFSIKSDDGASKLMRKGPFGPYKK